MSINEIMELYDHHHTSRARGYVSRKTEGYAVPYSGKFGTGFKIYRPAWDSTQFCYVEYWTSDILDNGELPF